jgi:predicted amidophosphoribosyltransferase
VVLIDDVTTTGATARACLQALADAGAKSVHALALLRTE